MYLDCSLSQHRTTKNNYRYKEQLTKRDTKMATRTMNRVT